MRAGVARDLLSKGVPDETVKKLLHHTPGFTDARRHYEGDLTNFDIVAMRANLTPKSAEDLDTLDRSYIFTDDKHLKLTDRGKKQILEDLLAMDVKARRAKGEYDKLSARVTAL